MTRSEAAIPKGKRTPHERHPAATHAIARAEVTESAIDTGAVLADVSHPSHGAALLFLGVVRDHNEGRTVRGIEYEAYRDMAEAELARIARECLDETGVDSACVSLAHRTGDLAVGDVSLAVAVSTPHRADSYELSRALLETLKRRLPVWKKERYVDGESAWVEGVAVTEAGRTRDVGATADADAAAEASA